MAQVNYERFGYFYVIVWPQLCVNVWICNSLFLTTLQCKNSITIQASRVSLHVDARQRFSARPRSFRSATVDCAASTDDTPTFKTNMPVPVAASGWKSGAGGGVDTAPTVMETAGPFAALAKRKAEEGDAPAATPAPPAKAAAAPKASKAAKGVAAMIAESKAASNDAGGGKKTKKNKRNKRKGAGAGEGLGLLAKGMK